MSDDLTKKVIKIAAQICWMHGSIAGNRVCQDWSGDTDVLDTLTLEEKDKLMYQYEQYNSGGDDFEPGYFPYDEMLISFVTACVLEDIANEKPPRNP